MTFRLANDEITLAHSGGQVRLRPSLRAVSILEQEYGFEVLFRRIEECHRSVIADVIRTTATDHREADAFLEAMAGKPLAPFLDAVMPSIIKLVSAFIPDPVAPSGKGREAAIGKPIPWPEVYRELYHKGTGWLGWTPRQTWQATPNEINHAYAGYIAMLKATGVLAADEEDGTDTYSADEIRRVEELGRDPAFDRSAFNAFKQKLGGGA